MYIYNHETGQRMRKASQEEIKRGQGGDCFWSDDFEWVYLDVYE